MVNVQQQEIRTETLKQIVIIWVFDYKNNVMFHGIRIKLGNCVLFTTTNRLINILIFGKVMGKNWGTCPCLDILFRTQRKN